MTCSFGATVAERSRSVGSWIWLRFQSYSWLAIQKGILYLIILPVINIVALFPVPKALPCECLPPFCENEQCKVKDATFSIYLFVPRSEVAK